MKEAGKKLTDILENGPILKNFEINPRGIHVADYFFPGDFCPKFPEEFPENSGLFKNFHDVLKPYFLLFVNFQKKFLDFSKKNLENIQVWVT